MLLQAVGTGESAWHVMRLNRASGATARYAKQDSVKGSKTQGRHNIFLLSYSPGFKTTVLVDRAHALHGLLRDTGIADFEADYTKPVLQVYRDTTTYVLRLKRGLDCSTYALTISEPIFLAGLWTCRSSLRCSFQCQVNGFGRGQTELISHSHQA
ncbi:hypothetical protein DOTSEDRAFT_33136 [Dothistroma septosporum NZE10]|uniref:Uncharacterized protein n=1 Tax=Dothistroma septosporum (strain NZE10 / CBS 128990) TaxID=675120 RepID=N1PUC4_DOTSN|nr:hypothetical protein DOTSEDRAFT_33136 [Dothistroma septosporum NZE10]